MAELPELGKHCSMNDCNQLDFLPLCCKHCERIYCKDHHSINDHDCEEFLDKKSNLVSTSVQQSWKCPVVGCKEGKGAVHHACPLCGVHICLKHRHEALQSHSCPSLPPMNLADTKSTLTQDIHKKQFKEAFNAVEDEINGKLLAASHGKKKAMANHLRLMRLKSRAIGDLATSIPMASRAYFTIVSPVSHSAPQSSLPVYISKIWSLGKAIDMIEKILKLNIKIGQKLRLLHTDRSFICSDMSRTIASLLDDGSLIEGDTLLLEYLEQ